MSAAMTSSVATPSLRQTVALRPSSGRPGRQGPAVRAARSSSSRGGENKRSKTLSSSKLLGCPSAPGGTTVFGTRKRSASTQNSAISVQSPSSPASGEFEPEHQPGSSPATTGPKMMTFTAEELAQRDVKAFRDFKSQEAKRRIQRKPWSEMKFKEQFEFAFVRFTLTMSGGFVLLGVVSSLCLSGLLFSMGMKEVMFDAVTAWMNYNPVELVASAVGALDRFLLGMVCLVFGLGSYELFLARSNRDGEVRDAKLKKLSWLRVSSIDDLEQKVGEIIVAVMVVNLLEMSLHMKYTHPVDLVWAAMAAVMSAGALALLHFASGGHGGKEGAH
uniref:Uncharacterized protein n=1 Tax=Mantoniella antarctica TaxID=81844 RepID=A0A7S0T4K6_9CHLO|mmetsp:Transcript_6462/g.16084  ORF Transcript_6462/g.16084 Transcript_6462/m.16084 type:complete len:331 (+) Transcript_6462:48-1040(+)